MKNEDKYVYGIDALRFLCALLVAIFHLTWTRVDETRAIPFGWIGVQIFFVISGVVIANSASFSSPRDFLVGRFLRLYPAAWLAALISFSIFMLLPWSAFKENGVNIVPQLGALARSLTLVGDYFLTSSYWTLPVELAFYLVVYLSMLTGGRVNLLWIARLLVMVSAPYLIFAFIHRLGLIDAPWLEFGNGLANALLVRHGPYFAIGIYIWMKIERRPLARSDNAVFILALSLSAIEIAIKSLILVTQNPVTAADPRNAFYMITFSLVTFSLFLYGIYFSMRYRETIQLSTQSKRILRTAGLMTYPFYLLHESVGGATLHMMGAKAPAVSTVLAAIVVSGAVAYLVCALGEPWLRKWLRSALSILRKKEIPDEIALANQKLRDPFGG
jgi:exopolysaccharide production protein ExoZ